MNTFMRLWGKEPFGSKESNYLDKEVKEGIFESVGEVKEQI